MTAQYPTQLSANGTFEAGPRAIYHLSRVFGVDSSKFAEISGAATSIDRVLGSKALKFAAKSDGVSTLNSEEQELLDEFVRLLNKA